MSWAEVKKINGDMTNPINHWLWANDYKTYGEQSYVYRNKTIFAEFYKVHLPLMMKCQQEQLRLLSQ